MKRSIAWEMWRTQLEKYNLTDRDITLSKSSFEMGWEARGVHEAREDKDIEPIAWYVADKNGNPVTWICPLSNKFDPTEGGFAHHPSIADTNEPKGAPHSWQPLVPRKAYHANKD
jgi:hypothetical protein